MDLLQAGGESPLAVLPQSAVLVQPGQTALHHPALGHDREELSEQERRWNNYLLVRRSLVP